MVNATSTATIVQASGVQNTAIQKQFGGPTNAGTLVQRDVPDSTGHVISFDEAEDSGAVVQFGGTAQLGHVLQQSPELSSEQQFVVFFPELTRGLTFFSVLGTSASVEDFFDRSPFFFTPSETDPNTLRDISEAQQFMVFSSATIFGEESIRNTPSFTTLISIKGTEIDPLLDLSSNIISNGSFEAGLTSWVTSTGVPADIIEVRKDQPTDVGFDDFNPVVPTDGDDMLYLHKETAVGVITLLQTARFTQLSSDQLRNFQINLAPDGLDSLMPFVAQLLFRFRDTTVHSLRYRRTPAFLPTIPEELEFVDSTVTFELEQKVFNEVVQNVQEDTSFATFNFDEVQLWLLADATISGVNMLVDGISLTVDAPGDHLLPTDSFAHINTAHPTASGFPFTISGSDDIIQTDEFGPFFDETSPASGTSFNDPSTQVQFHIKDDGSALDQGTINIFIDGLQVISAGSTVTGTTWPIASKTVLTPNNIEYIFTRGEPFPQQGVVVVSGSMADFATPANLSNDSYSFEILGSGTLAGTISGSPDADAPVITAVDPAPGATQISPDTAIIWTTTDNAAGVDPSTIKLFLNGGLVVEGAIATAGDLSRVANANLGFNDTYTPDEPFEFGTTVSGLIEAKDNVGNTATLPYEFTITPDDTLAITNFFLSENESTLLTSGTTLTVCVEDFTHGVNVSGTFLTINGETPTGLITSTSGVPSSGTGPAKVEFSVLMEPLVTFREDLVVFVHGENNFPGAFPVIEEEVFVLRPGYDVVWPNKTEDAEGGPEDIFPFVTNIQVLADIKNFAKNFAQSTEFFRFLTENQQTANLGASIEANIKVADLSATLTSLNPYFVYGKTMTLEIEADDLEGNQLRFTHTFTIESKPT